MPNVLPYVLDVMQEHPAP
ncbi:hypothetical protein A2U01_0091691, partial [Trifolium medium]|nr:hypothetical protein [Trifolium medium]